MYPLNTEKPWALNQWYIAAFSSEVKSEPLGRTLLGKKVVLLRGEGGEVHGLSGICPHRMMPMDKGSFENGVLTCAYHGLGFSMSGECVSTPTSSIKANCRLHCYPVKEVGPLVWIWPGDTDKVDYSLLPDQASIGIGADGWRTDCVRYFPLQARYQLLLDNLFDLSHLGFVHASIVGSGGIALVEPKVERKDGRIIISRTLANVETDGYHRFLHPGIGDTMSVRVESDLVGVGLLNAGGPAWNGDTRPENILGHMNFIHGVTPETEHTTNYFSILCRDFREEDDGLTDVLAKQNVAVIQQDIDVLEEIERLLSGGDIELPKEISIGSDTGGIQARRYLINLIEND